MPSLPGTLHLYSESPSLPVFESGIIESKKILILLPGLTDGMFSLPYATHLSGVLAGMGWSMAQPHLSSAYNAYGRGSLEKDVQEIENVVEFFKKSRGKDEIVLMGSSTGCQQIMQYLLSPHISGKTRSSISRGILQAPVSDRECFTQDDKEGKVKKAAELARSLHDAGKDDELMPAGSLDWGADVTVYRAWSLLCEGGDDDYFSTDIPLYHAESQPTHRRSASQQSSFASSSSDGTPSPHRPLSETFSRLPEDVPILALFSGADECTPKASYAQPLLLSRWKKMAPDGVMRGAIIPGASHVVKQEACWGPLGREIARFLQE